MPAPFLTAEWKWLAMANYAVDPAVLQPYLPAHTELDAWNGQHFISLVGFMFLKTRLKGIPVPFHTKFEEVNLRIYVRHKTPQGEWRRGVVFITEIVPLPTLALIANTTYQEHYRSMPMRHDIAVSGDALNVTYQWKNGSWQSFSVKADPKPFEQDPASMDAFITEHYYGYTRVDDRKTGEYRVEHPVWRLLPVKEWEIKVDFGSLYGPGFAFLNEQEPKSVLLAEGSPISVLSKRRIENP